MSIEDTAEEVKYNHTQEKRLKAGVTMSTIIVWIRTTEERHQDITREEEEARQGYMGAKMTKRVGVLAPLTLVVRMQPDHEKQIRLCMKKWHKHMSGRL